MRGPAWLGLWPLEEGYRTRSESRRMLWCALEWLILIRSCLLFWIMNIDVLDLLILSIPWRVNQYRLLSLDYTGPTTSHFQVANASFHQPSGTWPRCTPHRVSWINDLIYDLVQTWDPNLDRPGPLQYWEFCRPGTFRCCISYHISPDRLHSWRWYTLFAAEPLVQEILQAWSPSSWRLWSRSLSWSWWHYARSLNGALLSLPALQIGAHLCRQSADLDNQLSNFQVL